VKISSGLETTTLLKGRTNSTGHSVENEMLFAWQFLNAIEAIAIIAIDEKHHVYYANPYACEIFSLDFRMDGIRKVKLSDAFNKQLRKALKLNNHQFIFHHTVNEATQTLRVVCSSNTVPFADKVLTVIQIYDISNHQIAAKELQDRSVILDALISSDWLLHSSESWQTVATAVLKQLCIALKFTRAAILKKSDDRRSHLLFKWATLGAELPDHQLEVIDFDDERLSRWKEVLKQGKPVFGNIADLPIEEYQILQQQGTQSIAVVPIFSDAGWWGNIIIERCDDLIKTTPQELGSLMAIGRSLSVAIQRELATTQLHQAKIAFNSATEGIMIIDTNSCITGINKGFTDITGFGEEDVLGSTPKVLQHAPHDLWDNLMKEGKWRGEVTNTRKNGESYQEWLTITVVKNEEDATINYVGVFSDITEIKNSKSRLNELLNHDTLTGLPNRRLLNELLTHAFKRAERKKHQIALLFINLDRFKAVNENLGHESGDQLLHQVSRRLTETVRDSDIVARIGGDEFVVMMDIASNPDDATLIAQKIIHALQVEFVIESKELFITASVGISLFPKDGAIVDEVVKAADVAMNHVKTSGKNNFCLYSPNLSKDISERFVIETQLRKALERNQFEVYYQPQISLLNGDIIGAEALVRWNHPDLGIVSPAKFIPLAEETGLIISIGEWVLREAALQAMQWCQPNGSMQWISVNVSGVQVMQSNFADTVYGVLIETDCNPAILELEITESTVMQNTEYVIETFARIKQLGLHLAIDDFGTGYSSLSNLKRLPLDKLKIDQSFVRDLPDDMDDAAIVNAIFAMARSLGFNVIAEGVETNEQAAFLSNMGCIEAQGYLFSKPVIASEFTALLTQHNFKERLSDVTKK
jgi:diguanylate cyclase (GGDEF)-like protein/PAS domain S-box-containing protein